MVRRWPYRQPKTKQREMNKPKPTRTNGRATPSADRVTVQAPELEQPIERPPLAAKETPRLAGPLRVVVTSYLRRLRDADGTSSKYIVDALVDAGLLAGDGPEIIVEVVHRQIKSQTDYTVVDFYSV